MGQIEFMERGCAFPPDFLAKFDIKPNWRVQKHYYDEFPIYIGDDGGYCYFQCEVPIAKDGSLIVVGECYETRWGDLVQTTTKSLKQEGHYFKWEIGTSDDDDFRDSHLVLRV